MEVHKDNHIYIDKRKVTGVFKYKIFYKVYNISKVYMVSANLKF